MAYFIAVIPHGLQNNNELRRLFSKFKRTLDDKGKEVRWVATDLWHVTVQYLGDISETQKKQVIELLETWEPPPEWNNITLRLSGVGAFPSPFSARVLWLGIQKSQSLIDAQTTLQDALSLIGLGSDEKNFTPHLTLARFRNLFNATSLTQLGGRKHFGDYPVTELILFESVVENHMKKYIPIYRKKLSTEELSVTAVPI
jgi:RNA 2',3'-cyclic 3'-phosphodiesterase